MKWNKSLKLIKFPCHAIKMCIIFSRKILKILKTMKLTEIDKEINLNCEYIFLQIK